LSSNIKNKVYIKSVRPVAENWMAYFVSVVSVILFVLLVFSLYGGIVSNYIMLCVCLLGSLVSIGTLLYFNNKYTWTLGATLGRSRDGIVYEYMEIIDMMGKKKCTHILRKVSKVRIGKRHIKVYGNIEFKGIVGKSKTKNKIIIYDYTQESIDFLKDNLPESCFSSNK